MTKRKLLVILWLISIICLLSGCDVFNNFFQSSLTQGPPAQERGTPGPDTNPPSPGNGGLISIEQQESFSLELNWQAATDDFTAQKDLDYALFITDDFEVFDDTSGNTEDWIILIDWQKNIVSYRVEGLLPSTHYFFKLMVRDKAGNSAAYIAISANTNDDRDAPQTGTILIEDITNSGFSLSWTAASDDFNSQDELEYKAFCSSDPSLKDYESRFHELEYYNKAQESLFSTEWMVNRTSTRFDNLDSSTTYYVLVFVRDLAGNIAFYNLEEITTYSDAPPIPGSEGLFKAYQKDTDYLFIAWPPASDDYDPQETLEYKVIASTQNDLSNFESIDPDEEGFVLCQDWAAGKTSLYITNLQLFQSYNINVMVRDGSQNISLYQPIFEKLAKLGDVDQDLLISSNDAKRIARYDAGYSRLEDLSVANVNGDFEVNIIDALVIQQYNSGLIESFGYYPIIQGLSQNDHAGEISLVPDKESGSMAQSEILKLSIFMNPGDQKIGAFKWIITFDAELLTVSNNDVEPNYANFSFECGYIKVLQNQGQIIFNGFSTKGFEIDSESPMVHINFRPLKKGNGEITLQRVLQVDETLHTVGSEQDLSYVCPLEIR